MDAPRAWIRLASRALSPFFSVAALALSMAAVILARIDVGNILTRVVVIQPLQRTALGKWPLSS